MPTNPSNNIRSRKAIELDWWAMIVCCPRYFVLLVFAHPTINNLGRDTIDYQSPPELGSQSGLGEGLSPECEGRGGFLRLSNHTHLVSQAFISPVGSRRGGTGVDLGGKMTFD
jgi:hypothetical protein